jgi:GTP-binding protein
MKYPEIAVVGRSNVGKSSLINMLMGKKQIAKSSNKPGKTQLINYFDITNDT